MSVPGGARPKALKGIALARLRSALSAALHMAYSGRVMTHMAESRGGGHMEEDVGDDPEMPFGGGGSGLGEELEELEINTEEQVIAKLAAELRYSQATHLQSSPRLGYALVPVVTLVCMTAGMARARLDRRLAGLSEESEEMPAEILQKEEFLRQLDALPSAEETPPPSPPPAPAPANMISTGTAVALGMASHAVHVVGDATSAVAGTVARAWGVSVAVAQAGSAVARAVGMASGGGSGGDAQRRGDKAD
ncbi:hypothetical protein JKP88DRAFT_351207 [Tribonema minus]|uniref:Uncharacterized protein n=1 Tax=Tribonema minus TaxID=303371 RepID=A0A835YIT7_9STRA|nr:hypothetical protein JKP88DRAFT_351207 [Tribonema minus]